MTEFASRLIFTVISAVVLTTDIGRLAAEDPKSTADAEKPAPVEARILNGLTLHSSGTARLVWSALLQRSDSLIGVDAMSVDEVLRSHLALAEGKGVLVSAVADDSPAQKAGLQKNDVLLSVGDQEITSIEHLEQTLRDRVEQPTPISLMRAGKKQTLEIIPKSPKPRQQVVSPEPTVERLFQHHYWLGVGLASADDTLRSHLTIPMGEGLVVTQVEESGPARTAGVMINDVLLKLDGKSLTTVEALVAQLQELADKSVPLELLRRGKPAMLTVTPEKHGAGMHEHLPELFLLATRDGSPSPFGAMIVRSYAADGGNVERFLANVVTLPKPDLSRQVADLVAQARQLQHALEALEAAVKVQEPTESPTDKK